jgi:prepilin-type N-terminal cleavage/methylation domain-containing protein
MIQPSKQQGFTLLELIVAVVAVIIAASVAYFLITGN